MSKEGKKSKRYKVLLPLTNTTDLETFLNLARTIVKSRNGRVVLLYIIQVAEERMLSEYATDAQKARVKLRKYLHERALPLKAVKITVRVTCDTARVIHEEATREQANAILLHWDMITASGFYQRLANLASDFVVVQLGDGFDVDKPWQQIENILMPVRGGAQAAPNLRMAVDLSDLTHAKVSPLHATRIERDRDAFQSRFKFLARGLTGLNAPIDVTGEVADEIIAQSVPNQVLIMGTPLRRDDTADWLGPVTAEVSKRFKGTFMVINRREAPYPQDSTISSWGERPLSVVVDRWFSENTFHRREFKHIETLVELKEAQGLTISLGLPALNEEETVGNVINTIKAALMDDIPLLDEMVLVDSNSSDNTRDIAADLGIPVYIHQEILPRYGKFRGKGEALWKSLYVLQGDIIVWIDTDIKNIHPRFVYGVIGPLLQEPTVQYVKGFYRRPLQMGQRIQAGGGGRVTELTARPLINLFYPELSGIIQPLSGEYGGRRAALEQVPFFTGYGVETGLLLDLYDKFGLHAIAQVDLVKRIHRNQDLSALSKMSFAIIQVVISRLEKQYKLTLLEETNLTMNIIQREAKRYRLRTEEVKERERPPMTEIPEYRERFSK